MDEDSPLTMGIGVFGLAGGGVNFAGSNTSPVLTPRQPPKYFGVGPIYSNMGLLSITPMASYQFTDKLAIGGGPVITSGNGNFNPAFFAGTPGPLVSRPFRRDQLAPVLGRRFPARSALRAER